MDATKTPIERPKKQKYFVVCELIQILGRILDL